MNNWYQHIQIQYIQMKRRTRPAPCTSTELCPPSSCRTIAHGRANRNWRRRREDACFTVVLCCHFQPAGGWSKHGNVPRDFQTPSRMRACVRACIKTVINHANVDLLVAVSNSKCEWDREDRLVRHGRVSSVGKQRWPDASV